MVQDKSLAYEVHIGEHVPKRLYGDEIRIAQVLTNLLTNAVKYTDHGKITLSLNAVKDGKDMDAIEYIVEDTGCGIKPEDMEKLFDSYGRVNLERNRRVEGTGLGMACSILYRFSSRTLPPLRYLEMVDSDNPVRLATSLIVD